MALDAARVAYLLDPVKLASEVGYPAPAVRERLEEESRMSLTRITCEEVQGGGLSGFTVLCVPGGFAPHLSTRLGESGAAAIRRWVRDGGGFVGVCAGAFLGCSLNLLPVQVRDLDHMGASPSPCLVRFTSTGQQLLGASADAAGARYANGPVFALPASTVELSLAGSSNRHNDVAPAVRVHTLAVYASSCRPAAVEMEGSPAIVAGMHGRGLVLLVSPHLEDGADERTRSPFRNLFRLAHAAGDARGDCKS
jgi:glutamine amidotransferase-like uncharacterized protein